MKLQRKPTHSSGGSSSSTPRTSSSSLDAKGNVTLLASRRKFFRQDNFIFANQCKSIGHLRRYKILLLLIIVCVCLLILYANSETLVQKPLLDFLLSDALETDGTSSTLSSSSSLASSNGDLDKYESSMTGTGNKINNKHHQHQNQHQHKEIHYTLPLKLRHSNITRQGILTYDNGVNSKTDFNIFVIYTKENYQLHMKFELFVKSLLKHSTARIHLHIITDNNSKGSSEEIIHQQLRHYHRSLIYSFYDINACAERVTDIVKAMRPHFSSTPRSYYSDTLFFLSLGLHRIADKTMDRAILLDCDIVFRSDVRHLFSEFEHFHQENLFGLAPELTPVYRHILYRYRANNPKTNFGTPYYPIGSVNRYIESNSNEEKFKILRAHRNNINNNNNNNNNNIIINNNNIHHGYPGLNSGVVLLYLSRIRSSDFYEETLKAGNVKALTTKYSFKGHLGDQDFYTLLGYEYPSLIYHLDCIWNRQLCTWWKDHGYSDIFDAYFHCEGKIKMYHGNCNTRVPE